MALTFAQYAAKPFFEECTPPELAVKLLAAVCLCNLSTSSYFFLYIVRRLVLL